MPRRTALLLAAACLAGATIPAGAEPVVLRVGYFPNVTHAQAAIGSQGTREGRGWFEERLGPGVQVRWFAFNAGPSAMEAMFAGSIDLTYVGPNPALNAYIRSKGEEVRILAGAAEGGAALVVREGAGISADADFRGRRVATPQLGNTQDVAARAHFRARGFRVTPTGGDVLVLPTPNAEQLTLFQAGRIDAAWTVEPWVTRLVREGGGRIMLEQRDALTTLLVASSRFLRTRPDLAERFRAAHGELTAWIRAHPEEAQDAVHRGLRAEMRRDVSADVIREAWPRLSFTSELRIEALDRLVRDAQQVGFLRDAIPLDRILAPRP